MDYKNATILDNFMICGIKPSTMWRNLLMQVLEDYEPEVLFSYPETESLQKSILNYIFPESFQLLKERPPENPLEKYIITNQKGETCYVYWKILYEEITEEFLYENYDIKKVKSNNPICVLPCGSIKHESKGSSIEKSYRGSALKILESGISPSRRLLQGISCFDEMDVFGSAYLRNTKRAKKNSEISQEQSEPSLLRNSSVFAPIAICIKTKIPLYEESERLLEEFIGLLYNERDVYHIEKHNKIYTFAEISTYILLLTNLTVPPPISEFAIQFYQSDVSFREGPLNDIPYENDPSVAQLFSLLSIDYIIELWTNFLLGHRTIICTAKPVHFFYITKGIEQLLFPFSWAFPKGITRSLDVITHITPYCFGVLKNSVPDTRIIHDIMETKNVPYTLLDIDHCCVATLKTYPKGGCSNSYHRAEDLKKTLTALCKKYFISNNGEIFKILWREREFSKRVRETFLRETVYLTTSVEIILKKKRFENFDSFSKEFVQNYLSNHPQSSAEEKRFIETLSESQALALIYDEIMCELQGNYSRVLAMKKGDQRDNCKKACFKLAIERQNVISFLQRITEIALGRKGEKREKPAEAEISLKAPFDWIKEIQRMKKCDSRRWKTQCGRLLYPAKLSTSRNSGPIEYSEVKHSGENWEEIVMTVVESKEPAKVSTTERQIEAPKHGPKLVQKRKGPIFYGPTGFHAFLVEMLSNSDQAIFEQHLVEEMKDCFERIAISPLFFERPVRAVEENKGSTASAGSIWADPIINYNPSITDSLAEVLNDSDSESRKVSTKPENELLSVTPPNSSQFFLYIAFYYTKYKKHIYEIIKAYMEAYNALHGLYSLHSVFPLFSFKEFIKKLDFTLVRELLICAGELTSIIKDVYDSKASPTKWRAKKENKRKLDMIKKIVNRASEAATLKRSPKKRNKKYANSTESTADEKSNRVSSPFGRPFAFYSKSGHSSPEGGIRGPYEYRSRGENLSSRESTRQYLNTYAKKCKFVNLNPVVIMESLLKDLMTILNATKSKGHLMFHAARKHKHFIEVEEQAAALRQKDFFIHWLSNDSEKISFFVNLHNFLILFALCKDGKRPLPNTLFEWLQYKSAIAIKVGNYIFSALEIEHAVLRAHLAPPKIPSPYADELPFFSKFQPGDEREMFKVSRKIKHIIFALFIPTRSSPTLRVYSPHNVQDELNKSAEQYLAKTAKYKGKGMLVLPETLEWYATDFEGIFGKQGLISFVLQHLPKSVVEGLRPE